MEVKIFQAKTGKFSTILSYTIKNSVYSKPKQVFFFLHETVA